MNPDLDDVRAAAARLAGRAVRTPLLESPLLSRELGFRLLIKAEPLQRTGSFKFRGAFNRLSLLTERERRHGVVAFSSGNHAQGVAAAAALLDIPAVIVMPADAPPIKLANTRAYGAEIITYDRWTESRERIAADIAEQRGAVLVKPFDDPLIIAGQGTVGLEIVEQAAELGIPVDALVAGASGGGLIAGTAIAVSALSPETRLYCAEPAGFDDHARSLAVGSIVANAPGGGSICDALLSPRPGDVTFPINRQLLSGGLVATDDETCRAMAVAFGAFKLVLEPGGAVALAAALAHRVPGNPTSIVVVASGGNVEPALFARAIMTGS